jgi:hypothetical protein
MLAMMMHADQAARWYLQAACDSMIAGELTRQLLQFDAVPRPFGRKPFPLRRSPLRCELCSAPRGAA